MTNEDKAHKAIARAAQAEALLRNEMLDEAFKALEASYIGIWKSTATLDQLAREKLWLAVSVVTDVRKHLVSIVQNGQLAQREIDELLARRNRRAA